MCFILVPPTPISAVEPLERRPVFTYGFLTINAIVWIILNFLSIAPFFTNLPPDLARKAVDWLGFIPKEKHLWTYLTYSITQIGILHLVFNLLFLWMFGGFLEEKLGGAVFVVVVLVGAVAGCVGHDLYVEVRNNSDLDTIPLIGASGVVMTILGTYLVLLPKKEFRFFCGIFGWFFRPVAFYDTVVMPAAFYIPVFVVANEVIKLFSAGETSVSHATHVGGLTAGVLMGLFIRFLPRSRKMVEAEKEKVRLEETKKATMLRQNFLDALQEKRPEVALSVMRYAERQGQPLELEFAEKIQLCDLLTETGEYFLPEKMYRELLESKLTEDQRLDVSLRLATILLKFERNLETCKDLLRVLYRRYRGHPRIVEVNRLIEAVKEAEKNLYKRPQ